MKKATYALLLFLLLYIPAQAQNNTFWKQNPGIRGYLLPKERMLYGPVKSVAECRYAFDEDKGKLSDNSSCMDIFFNEKERLSTVKLYSPGDRKENIIFEKYYYNRDRLDSISGSRVALYHYDQQGRLSSINYYRPDDRQPDGKDIFTYDAGELITVNTHTDEKGAIVYISKYTYDSKGEFKTLVLDESIYTYTYAADGSTLCTVKDARDPSRNMQTNTFLNGRQHMEKIILFQNDKRTVTTYTYEYDRYGNWIKQVEYHDGKIFASTTRQIAYRDEAAVQNPVAAKPEPATKTLPATNAGPGKVLELFFDALNKQDFSRAYSYCRGKRWGSLQQFSSVQMYGGITRVQVRSIKPPEKNTGNSVSMEASTEVDDPTNGDGNFVQNFILEKDAGGTWKITDIKLLSNSRNIDNRNLKIPAQADFGLKDVAKLTRHIYDTLSNEPQTSDAADTVKRSFTTLKFVKAGNALFAFAICENTGPGYGVSVGWCDVFAFTKSNNKWIMTDYLLQAGGGGMYGYSGSFDTLLRVGKEALGIVLDGGQTHMGTHFFKDIIALQNGKLSPLVSVTTYHDYASGAQDVLTVCQQNKYSFEKNGREMYDLKIVQYDCRKGEQKKATVVIPYKEGYTIPDKFIFEN